MEKKITEKFVDENNFDYEQYKKDMEYLKDITDRIIKNNPIYAKGHSINPDGTYNSFNYEKKENIIGYNYSDYEKRGKTENVLNEKEDLINELSKSHNDVDGTNYGWNPQNIFITNKRFKNKSTGEIVKADSVSGEFIKLDNGRIIKKDNFFKQYEEYDRVKWFNDDGTPITAKSLEQITKQKIEDKKKEPSFQKELDEIMNLTKNKANTNIVDDHIVKMINEKVKENNVVFKPAILQDLEKLNMYRVFAIEDDKFNCTYMDYILEENDKTKDTTINWDLSNASNTPIYGSDKFKEHLNIPTISLKLFSAMGRLKKNYIDVVDKNLDISVKDFINDEFIKKVKNLSIKNTSTVYVPSNIKSDLNLNSMSEIERRTKIPNKINMISNYLQMKTLRGTADFIISSKKNIDIILQSYAGYYNKISKTYMYNKVGDSRWNMVVNDDLGDMVIVGRNPKEEEVGIKLVVNTKTLNNFIYSDDDIKAISLNFNFFDFGNHPEYNYFNFEMKS